jgi:hypothetical protein
MNALIHIPYALQLASGWTRLTMYNNAIALCLLAPATFLLARRFGAIGAASVWLILNAGYIFINVPLMHRRLLVLDQWRWYATDVGLPLCGSIAGTLLWLALVRQGTSPLQLAMFIAGASTCTVLCSAVAAPATRQLIKATLVSAGPRLSGWRGMLW